MLRDSPRGGPVPEGVTVTRCAKCQAEPRYAGLRWGPKCMGAYVAARRQFARQAAATASRAEIPTAEGVMPTLRPADLPHAILGLLGPEDQETYQRYVLAQSASIDMLRHLLRFGIASVRARGWAR